VQEEAVRKSLIVLSLSFWVVVSPVCLHMSAFDGLNLFSSSVPCFESVDQDDTAAGFEKKEKSEAAGFTIHPLKPFLCEERGDPLVPGTPVCNSRSSVLRF
jgi:hypothetical protein